MAILPAMYVCAECYGLTDRVNKVRLSLGLGLVQMLVSV